jgi:hypothetical protein
VRGLLRGAGAVLLGFIAAYLFSFALLWGMKGEDAGGWALQMAIVSAAAASIASLLGLALQFALRSRQGRAAGSRFARLLPAPNPNGLAAGTGVALIIGITVPLYGEFFEPRHYVWDAFLALFLLAVLVAGLRLGRFFASHAGELGEARFDTHNEVDVRG